MTIPTVCLYGQFVGNGSFARVTQGWQEAMQAHEIDFLPFDAEAADVRRLAPIAIITDPSLTERARSNTQHKKVFIIIAPHTGWLPDFVLDAVCTGRTLLVPSHLCRQRIHVYHGMKARDWSIRVVPHGVSHAFRLDRGIHGREDVKDWRLVHLAESSAERKGTRKLIHALKGSISSTCTDLMLVPSHKEAASLMSYADKNRVCMQAVHRINGTAEQMAAFYPSFDAIVQPSRAEGFGLCPLEALCCGVPAIITKVHGEWCFEPDSTTPIPGVTIVKMSGRLRGRPVDFEPGEVPEVRVRDIRAALWKAWLTRDEKKREAMDNADALREKWLWKNVLAEFLEEIKGE